MIKIIVHRENGHVMISKEVDGRYQAVMFTDVKEGETVELEFGVSQSLHAEKTRVCLD